MSIEASTDRFVLKNSSGSVVTDTSRLEMIVTDTFSGVLSFPAYTTGASPVVSKTQTTIAACNAGANAVLGVAKFSTATRVVAFPLGGTRILYSSYAAMANDPLNMQYTTKSLGPSVASLIQFITFYVESGAFKYEYGIFVPRDGGPTYNVPALTLTYNALCVKI